MSEHDAVRMDPIDEAIKAIADGHAVIVVDDVITTGGSTLKAIDAIEAEGGKIAFALVLVDREEGGREAIEARGVPVVALFRRSSLLE